MSQHRFGLPAAVAAALLLCAPTLSAGAYEKSDPYYRQRSDMEKGEFEYDDSKDVPWREDKVPVPPAPDGAALAELRLDTLQKPFTAFLDTQSLAVNPVDRVLRYWLVVRSGSSTTTSYEGINCSSREYKTYAFADPREPSGLRLMRDPKWVPLDHNRRGDFRLEMADSYLCLSTDAKRPQDVVGSIRGNFQRGNPFSEYRDNARPFVP